MLVKSVFRCFLISKQLINVCICNELYCVIKCNLFVNALFYVCASEKMAARLLAMFALSVGLTTALPFDGAGK